MSRTSHNLLERERVRNRIDLIKKRRRKRGRKINIKVTQKNKIEQGGMRETLKNVSKNINSILRRRRTIEGSNTA